MRWWVTPGGGIDPGESETEAAVREVREETGFDLDPGALLGPVARRHVVHGYSDQVIEQDEAFYLAQVDTFDVDVTGHTPEERSLQGLALVVRGGPARQRRVGLAPSARGDPPPARPVRPLARGDSRFEEESTVPDVA